MFVNNVGEGVHTEQHSEQLNPFGLGQGMFLLPFRSQHQREPQGLYPLVIVVGSAGSEVHHQVGFQGQELFQRKGGPASHFGYFALLDPFVQRAVGDVLSFAHGDDGVL